MIAVKIRRDWVFSKVACPWHPDGATSLRIDRKLRTGSCHVCGSMATVVDLVSPVGGGTQLYALLERTEHHWANPHSLEDPNKPLG